MKAIPLFVYLCLFAGVRSLYAHPVAAEMANAASNFLASLTVEQKTEVRFEIGDDERQNWHFIPRARKGLAMRELTLTQQQLALVLLQSPLSHRGYFKAVTIMTLDQVLYELEDHSPRREPGQYYVSIFGLPGQEPWGWRVEGHHLSLNFTVANGAVATTPSFFGTNPAEVRSGPRAGLRVLAKEEDLGLQLVSSLTESQRESAVIEKTAPRDIITGAERRVSALQPKGIAVARLNPQQREVFMGLLCEYVFRHRAELAEEDWKRIEATKPEALHFAWAGGLERGQGTYYRIQGPWFLIEFDNTQNDANHIHTVWRDLQNDFGEDLLRQHYEQQHRPK